MNNYILYRDLENQETYVGNGILKNYIRSFNEKYFSYFITTEKVENVDFIPIKNFLKENTPFADFLKSNKELYSKEIIPNINNEPIDRGLAHLIGASIFNGKSHTHKSSHLWISIRHENKTFLVFSEKAKKSGKYNPTAAAGHISMDDNGDIEGALIREIEEELGIKSDINNINFVDAIVLNESRTDSKVNSEITYCYNLRSSFDKLKKMTVDEDEILAHYLIEVEELNKIIFSDNKAFVKYRLKNGILEEVNIEFSLNNISTEFVKNVEYLKKQVLYYLK